MPLSGIKFGQYTLLRRIASGGMAEIFLARQEGIAGFAREIVIKRIHEHLNTDPAFISMFLDEARIVAKLSHPNIVSVHGFGKEGPSLYLAMEHVDGGPFSTVINQSNGVPPALCLRVVSEVCAGLGYAHSLTGSSGESLGIVHRDISPHNVLVGFDGAVKIIDFGIAKAATQLQESAGSFKGKYSYMAPEQARGKHMDHRSDIHAVGIILWEGLMGERLFQKGSLFQAMDAVLNLDPPKVSDKIPELGPRIDEILGKALAKEPDDRYQSCRQMQFDLDEIIAEAGLHSSSLSLGKYVRELLGDNDESAQFNETIEPEIPPAPEQRPSYPDPADLSVDDWDDQQPTNQIEIPYVRLNERAQKYVNDSGVPYEPTPAGPLEDPFASPESSGVPQDFAAVDGAAVLDEIPPQPYDADPTQEHRLRSSSGYPVATPDMSPAPGPVSTPAPAPAPARTSSQSNPAILTDRISGIPEQTDAPDTERSRSNGLLFGISAVVVIALIAAGIVWGISSEGVFSYERPALSQSDSEDLVEQASLKALLGGQEAPDQGREPNEIAVKQSYDADADEETSEVGTEAEKTSYLTIVSTPEGAAIHLDGIETGKRTSTKDLPVEAGDHVVELSLRGYKRWRKSFRIEVGEKATVRASLSEVLKGGSSPEGEEAPVDYGLLSVDTTPPSRVFHRRRSLGRTPLHDVELPVGTFKVWFVLDNGQRFDKTITIRSGRTTRREFKLGASNEPETQPDERNEESSDEAEPKRSRPGPEPVKGSEPQSSETNGRGADR